MRQFFSAALVLLPFSGLLACTPSADGAPEDAGPAKSALGAVLANVTQQALSDECPAGGVDIEVGVDANADETLSSDEVNRVVTVCNGTAGAAALADVDTLGAGDACPAGGVRVRTGLDDDGDGTLDDEEVLRSEQLCNGAAGANGLTTLVVVEETEADEACPAGGVRISAGLDADGDGELGDGETTQEALICKAQKGAPGADGYTTLSEADDQVGDACDAYGNGGQRIRIGLDNGDGGGIARNGQLEDGEVDSTTYVCNGANGSNGQDGQDGQDGQTGPRGDAGPQGPPGQEGQNGQDGQDGQDGKQSLIRVETELGGPNCPYGGVKILSGIDDNGDNTLQGNGVGNEEVDSVAYVCSAVPGDCSTGYHDGGDGSCVDIGTCVSSYHDGGDGTCVDVGTCLTGYHDGGNGTCVAEDTCAVGYELDSNGDCYSFEESTIPAGPFEREGSTVRITRPMAMMTTEVTQGLWKEISGGSNPAYFSDCDGAGGDSCPVETVDWFSAVGFANALSTSKGLTACYTITGCSADDWQDGSASSCTVSFANTTDPLSCTGYRLPTEAEWEYAYRAGTTTDFYNGDKTNNFCDDPLLDAIGWYCGNSNDTTHPVGQKTPNAWGLYDMAGNVWEWTWDWYGDYPGATSDHTGPETGNKRVLRGGSWDVSAVYARAANRLYFLPDSRNFFYGFRLTRTLP